MGREQTQKFRPAPEDPNKPAIINPVLPVKQFPKPPRNNVFGIGGTVENPNPYKTQPQKDFQTFTQTITYDLFQGTSPFSGNSLPIPEPANPKEKAENGETCTKCDSERCTECDAWDVQCELGHMASGTCTPPEKPPENGCDIGCVLTGRGCDCGCNDLKPCTQCDSAVCEECDAWDLTCEDCHKKAGTCTKPDEPDWIFWIKIIAVIIGIGVFLWLLRPLFSRGKQGGGVTIYQA